MSYRKINITKLSCIVTHRAGTIMRWQRHVQGIISIDMEASFDG